jgi:hypothetical protein
MGERTITTSRQRTTKRMYSWRDELAARYELQQARLKVVIEDSEEPEEHL